MNVGFYYHVEAVFDGDGTARVPALFGLFVEQLAKRAGQVTLYAHGESREGIEDYRLSEPLVRCIDLGPRRRFPERMLYPVRSLRSFRPHHDGVDVMLLRAPTPLLPHIVRASEGIPVALHVVGDYSDYKRDPNVTLMPWWRDTLIRVFFRIYGHLQRRFSRDALVLVNAPHLIDLFPGRDDVVVVFESTLSEESVVDAPATGGEGPGRSRPARLLFTGRLIPSKGLWEAVGAIQMLRRRGLDVTLDIVGYESPGGRVANLLRDHSERLGVEEYVRFLGYIPAGPPLAQVYRESDIYVLPTYARGEGFPRTVLEAMGSGIPVVTTPMGSIAEWLRDGHEAVLVEPGSVDALAEGIERLLTDDGFRDQIARNGWEFAKDWTVEKECQLLSDQLAGLLEVRTRSRPMDGA